MIPSKAALLPDDFQFSQSSLQDFADCPHRFFLRYVRQLRYPAAESAPLRDYEAQTERGARFHHLVHQHLVGIPVEALEAAIPDDTIGMWWDNYLTNGLKDLPPQRFPEIALSVALAGRRLVAKYDLLALGERAVIVDWKTTQRRPSREWLERRLQTRVYPYVLALAGAHLNGDKPLAPEAITMIYWFAQFPQQPEIFTYSVEQFERDRAALEALAADILRRSESDFELTENVDLCRFCSYRSLNERGVTAGDALVTAHDEIDDSFEIDSTPIGESQF